MRLFDPSTGRKEPGQTRSFQLLETVISVNCDTIYVSVLCYMTLMRRKCLGGF